MHKRVQDMSAIVKSLPWISTTVISTNHLHGRVSFMRNDFYWQLFELVITELYNESYKFRSYYNDTIFNYANAYAGIVCARVFCLTNENCVIKKINYTV